MATGRETVDLSLLVARLAIARDRALMLAKRHDRDGMIAPASCDPSTNVYELVDLLGVDY